MSTFQNVFKCLLVVLTIIVATVLPLSADASLFPDSGRGSDVIILRDGTILKAAINQTSGKSIKYRESGNSGAQEEKSLSEIYLISYANRGIVFFDDEGRRMSGSDEEVDSKATRIYTVDYRELSGYNVKFEGNGISYTTERKPNKKNGDSKKFLNISEVFIIVYPDGSTELVTELKKPEPEKKEDISQEEAEDDNLKVIFHNVKKGETLISLSKKYSVRTDDIKEWNDLPASTRVSVPLKTGTQLMIYVPKEK